MLAFSKGTLDRILDSHVADAKANYAALGYVKIASHYGTLSAMSTNLNVTAILTVEGIDGEDGEAILALSTLKALQDAMGKNGVSRIVRFDGQTLSGGSASMPASPLALKDFPNVMQHVPPVNPAECTTFKGGALLEALDAVGHAVSKDESSPNLCGVYLDINPHDKMRVVSTDAQRLSSYELDVWEYGNAEGKTVRFVLPAYALKPLKKALKGNSVTNMYSNDVYADFHVGDLRLIVRLQDVEFPDYRQVFPKGDGYTLLDLSPKTFCKVLKVKGYNSMVFYADRVVLTNVDLGDIVIKNQYPKMSNSEFKQAFNLQYVIDACTAPSTVEAKLYNELNPATFSYPLGNAVVKNLVMPMQI